MFRIDPTKVPQPGVRARCSVCGGVIAVPSMSAGAPDPLASLAMPAMATAVATRAPGLQTAGPVDLSPRPATPPASERTDPARVRSVDSGAAPASPPAGTAEPALTDRANAAPATPPAVSPEPRPAQPRLVPRRVNPYLANDPAQKARRLARALVSDLVAYNPQKREEGLRAGTLKELFRDEIRKSWQEYVDQVGAPLAESTPHFQDALNDILAGGRRVF